ncbi:MAG: DUF4942 domain-containing protein [Brevinema sp.]
MSNQFYPTPDVLIQKMIEPYRQLTKEQQKSIEREEGEKREELRKIFQKKNLEEAFQNKYIFDPSAGKGHILHYLYLKMSSISRWIKYFACEIDPEFRSILKDGKIIKQDSDGRQSTNHNRIEIVGFDFLEYKPDIIFDYIFMNPPFNEGIKHFLHAFKISQGADLVCILNAETLKNPYSEERKLALKLIEDNEGTIEYIQHAFSNAERPTDIEIALVRVNNKQQKLFEFSCNFQATPSEQINFEDMQAIMTNDVFKNNEIAFENAKKALHEFMQARKKLSYYTDMLFDTATATHSKDTETKQEYYSTKEIIQKACESNNDYHRIYNETVQEMKHKAWEKLTSIPKINLMLSETSRNELDSFIREMKDQPYTEINMRNIYLAILKKLPDIRKQCLIDAFDWLTKYFKNNRVFVEGWKTNDYWKVNKRCVLPNTCEFSYYSYNKDEIVLSVKEQLYNLEKSMMYLKYSTVNEEDFYLYLPQKNVMNGKEYLASMLQYHKTKITSGKKLESRFFTIKFYKKGTIHIEFKDLELLDLLNYIVCNSKNWLPDIEKKQYQQKYKNKDIPNWVKAEMNIEQIKYNVTVFENTGVLF